MKLRNLRAVSEAELRQMATENSKTIVVRTYSGGNSYDMNRDATGEEQKIIEGILYGALLSVRCEINVQKIVNGHGYDPIEVAKYEGIKNTAEFIGQVLLPQEDGNTNCYDTIYNRIRRMVEEK